MREGVLLFQSMALIACRISLKITPDSCVFNKHFLSLQDLYLGQAKILHELNIFFCYLGVLVCKVGEKGGLVPEVTRHNYLWV